MALRNPSYRSTQPLTLLWIVLPAAAIAATTGVALGDPAVLPPVLMILSVCFGALLLTLGRLVIELDDVELRWSFGFVGWPRWHMRLQDIASVSIAETSWIEGWGIRRTRQGWLYNASGRHCVRLVGHNGKVTRLGSQDPQRLRTFVEARLPLKR